MTGRVRLSIPPSMSDIIILPLVRSFQQAYPGVIVHCQVTERFIDHIADGVDLSLRVGQPKDSNLIATTVSVHRPRLVASPHYLATIAQLTHPDDLIPHIKIAFSRWEKPLKWTLSNATESAHIVPEPNLIINDYAGVLQGVIDGFGISELPGFICQPALDDGRLREVLPDWQFASTQVCLTYPSRYLSPAVRVFRDFCVGYFETRSLS